MSTAIAPLFVPGLNKFFFLRSERYQGQWNRVFTDTPMTGRVLMRQQMETYQPPQITLPLNPVHMGEIKDSFSSAYTPIKRTLGDVLSVEDWDDDEYGVLRRVVPAHAGAMADIYAEKREYDCANYLAVTGFTTTSPAPHSPDGVALASSSHPISKYNTSTWSNIPSAASTSASNTAYYAAYANMVQQFAPDGYSIRNDRPSKVVYNPTQRAVWVQIAKGDWERASGTQAFQGLQNAAKADGLELVEWPHYRRTLAGSAANTWDSWWIFGQKAGLVFANRQSFKALSTFDYNQLAYLWVTYVRYDLGHDYAYSCYASG